MIQLNEVQLECAIYEMLQKETGLNSVMTLILNGLMKLEREVVLSQQKWS